MSSPWEHLLASTVSPAAAVAVKMAAVVEDDARDNTDADAAERRDAKRPQGLLAALKRRLPFRRMSLTGEKGGTPSWRYRQTRFSSRRVRKRVVFKNGECNVVQGNVAKRRRRYLQDIFTTLVDAQWRWTLLVFALNFLLSWLAFATLWFVVALAHGDLAEGGGGVNGTKPERPCVEGLNGFTSCFLFSVETQHTIGYGSRSPTEECPEAIFILCLQSICGVMIQAFMVGIVFAKLSRPKKRTQTLLFSRHSVVCQRDGALCLMFRVGDMRKSHIVEAHVRAQLIRRKTTLEGEVLPFCQQELRVGGDGDDDRIFFIWPTVIAHRIDAESPLYGLSAADMLRERFEIVVILEGVIESTGMTTQARSSYLPNEVLWGHRFRPMVTFKKGSAEYEVDYSLFNDTYQVDTPLCSAKHLDQVKLGVLRETQVEGETPFDATLLRTLDRLMSPGLPALGPAPLQTQPTRDEGPTPAPWAAEDACLQLPRDLPGPESRI